MKVETAQLPGPDESNDRIFVTANAVIMLDGASCPLPTAVCTGDYVDRLGDSLGQVLTADPEADLVGALSASIEYTAASLDLEPGRSPSSTVAVARIGADNSVDALVLGDTQIAWPGGVLRDERIATVGTELREAYRERLAAGFGYDDEHRDLIRRLQEEQTRNRNRPGGYWIAETDRTAAQHSMIVHWAASATPWAVLATDGAYRPLEKLGLDNWADLATRSSAALYELLCRCHRWEEKSDPGGVDTPRAKRQDDKTLLATTFMPSIALD